MYKILVAGCGFAGSTIARILAENGFKVTLIEKRNHVGGNAFDFINDKKERIHKYGPHLFHCNKESSALVFLNRFTEWILYKHKVRAKISDNKTTPLPVNRNTLEDVFNIKLKDEKETIDFIGSLRVNEIKPKNTDQLFLSSYGEVISNIFFRPYTRKMWGVPPNKLDISVGARLPFKNNRDDFYFNDNFQALPKKGYTKLFENMLDHKNIELKLNTVFEKNMEKDFDHSFLSIPIDGYFNYKFGKLPYRSILFENVITDTIQDAPVINFTDNDVYTRSTQWHLFPNSPDLERDQYTSTLEKPCSLDQNPGEYYYPIKTKDSKELYDKYFTKAKEIKNITFIGRTGLFIYIDMAPATTLHIKIAKDFLKSRNLLIN